MIVTHHRDKLINAIIYFATNTKYCGKTKLMKFLYFLDFQHLRETGKSVTGLDYFAWEKGPVPKDVYEELSDPQKSGEDLKRSIRITPLGDSMRFEKIEAKRPYDGSVFTQREKEVLERVAYVFRDARAHEIVEISHLKNQPWAKTLKEQGRFKKIDYLLSIDGTEKSLTYQKAKERMQEIREMQKVFGVQ
jgi:uncharacterized phage-associated protein